MQKDQPEEPGRAKQPGFDHYPAAADEAGGMDSDATAGRSRQESAARGREFGEDTHVNRATREFRQPDQEAFEKSCERVILWAA